MSVTNNFNPNNLQFLALHDPSFWAPAPRGSNTSGLDGVTEYQLNLAIDTTE